MRPSPILPFIGIVLATAAAHPASARGADDRPTIPGVAEAMESFIERREIAGAVTLVADEAGIRHLAVNGEADRAAGRPMEEDAIFWIASMTKPVTGTAVMMMQEEGKLSVDDPVSRHLPEFTNLKGPDGAPVEVTIRHILTHTAGLDELTREESAAITTLAELTPLVAAKPLKFAPGSQWRYCQTGINTAARIVEVVSGQSFPEFLEQRLFGPLGMKDTTFYLREAQAARLAKSYRRTDDGQLEETDLFFLQGKSPFSRDRCPMANGGLFSTARDFAAFCRMILRGGELDGTRYLKPESVRQMTTVQSGDVPTGFTPGNGWGLGWCVVREPQGVTESLAAGSFGHGGAYGTQAWIDPVAGRAFVLMVQRANFPNSDASDVRMAFQAAAAGK